MLHNCSNKCGFIVKTKGLFCLTDKILMPNPNLGQFPELLNLFFHTCINEKPYIKVITYGSIFLLRDYFLHHHSPG